MLDLGLLILRVVVGLLFIGHGSQKLFGWLGGYGLDGTGGWFASLGVRSPRLVALLVGLAELGGGLGLALGLLTPIAAAAISVSMLGAIALVHWPKIWVTEGGLEYPLVNLAVVALLGLAGPGAYALDAVLGLTTVLPMPWIYLVGLLVAILIVVATLASRQPQAQQTRETGKAA